MAQVVQDPGAFLAHMLAKYKLNLSAFSQDIRLSQPTIRLIIAGKAKITVSVALRLAKYFNTNPEFWLAMQMRWDVAEAEKEKTLMKVVKSISRVSKGTASTVAKKPVVKKTAAKKKVAAAKKSRASGSAAKKRVSAAKKPVARKKTATARKKVAKRRVTAAKKPVSRKKTVAARKKTAVKTRKKTSVRRGRPAAKRKR